jgi:hypothetical protein
MVLMASTALTPRQAADLLRASATAIRIEVAALAPPVAAWHPAPGEWCAREVVGHLIEAESRGFAGRVRQIAGAATEPRFTSWDPAAVARERHDCERETAALLDELDRLRAASVELVAGLREADLGRGGHHPTVGFLRVGDLLHEWVHHDRNHLKQILSNVQGYAWPHMGNAKKFSAPAEP